MLLVFKLMPCNIIFYDLPNQNCKRETWSFCFFSPLFIERKEISFALPKILNQHELYLMFFVSMCEKQILTFAGNQPTELNLCKLCSCGWYKSFEHNQQMEIAAQKSYTNGNNLD